MGFVGEFLVFFYYGVAVLIVVGLLRVLFSPIWNKRFLNKKRATPEEILKERYARGEISRDEYRQMLQEIRE